MATVFTSTSCCSFAFTSRFPRCIWACLISSSIHIWSFYWGASCSTSTNYSSPSTNRALCLPSPFSEIDRSSGMRKYAASRLLADPYSTRFGRSSPTQCHLFAKGCVDARRDPRSMDCRRMRIRMANMFLFQQRQRWRPSSTKLSSWLLSLVIASSCGIIYHDQPPTFPLSIWAWVSPE